MLDDSSSGHAASSTVGCIIINVEFHFDPALEAYYVEVHHYYRMEQTNVSCDVLHGVSADELSSHYCYHVLLVVHLVGLGHDHSWSSVEACLCSL